MKFEMTVQNIKHIDHDCEYSDDDNIVQRWQQRQRYNLQFTSKKHSTKLSIEFISNKHYATLKHIHKYIHIHIYIYIYIYI